MSEIKNVPQLNPNDFTLSSTDQVSVTMPTLPSVGSDDVDAQLFAYVANAKKGSGITSIADLDDAWVQATFEEFSTIEALRDAMGHDLEHQSRISWENLKFQKCCDALIERLEGNIAPEILDAHIEASILQYAERLRAMGMTRAQYLRTEHLTADEFDQKLRHDVVFQLKLNMALDKVIQAQGATVADDQLTDYLSCEDPADFMAELKENNALEDARHAATRVKVMRSIVDGALVSAEG